MDVLLVKPMIAAKYANLIISLINLVVIRIQNAQCDQLVEFPTLQMPNLTLFNVKV